MFGTKFRPKKKYSKINKKQRVIWFKLTENTESHESQIKWLL